MKKIILLLSFFLISQSSYSMDHARKQALFIQQTDREQKLVLIANAAAFSLGAARNLINCGLDLDCLLPSLARTSELSLWLLLATGSFHLATVVLRAHAAPTL